ncbi:MAG: alpha/beta hydrolase [Arcobacter sp.]|nr:MAG: alpha/beta hydrolase [Arcobacter sp.]
MKKLFFLFLFTSFVYSQYIKEPIFKEASYVETFGNPENEAIVFVHGLGQEASTIWKQSVEVLKKDYYIMIFDLPGFGKSDKSNQLYSPTKYAKFINTLVDNFIDKPFHLIGHSMGASIALKYSSMYEERVKSLVLIDAAAILNKISYSEFLLKYKVQDMVKNNSISTLASKIPQVLEDALPLDLDLILSTKISRKILLRSNPNTIAAMALVEEDFSQIPRKLQVQTLIIWGEKDTIAPLRTGYVLNKLIPNSKLEIIPDAKHVPIIDSSMEYLALLKKHLEKRDYEKKKKKYPSFSKTTKIENGKNRVLRGYFKNLEILNSKNIKIKNAKIENLKIINSEVKIINSDLNLKKLSSIKNSTLTISASDLKVLNSIDLFDSKLDLAGVDIRSKVPIFRNLNKDDTQNIVFSLCTINGKNKHGIKILAVEQVLNQ